MYKYCSYIKHLQPLIFILNTRAQKPTAIKSSTPLNRVAVIDTVAFALAVCVTQRTASLTSVGHIVVSCKQHKQKIHYSQQFNLSLFTHNNICLVLTVYLRAYIATQQRLLAPIQAS